jgi:phosphoribosyl 1,2-cyclic phosphodiesterase
MFRATFWGVRGSVPSPGPLTARVGGNTSCVEVLCDETRIVFDGGTGLRMLGAALAPRMPVTVHLFFSHVHWDHIQGFPFFQPAFVPGNTIHLYGPTSVTGTVESAMLGQMEGPSFPVKLSELPSTLHFHDITPGESVAIGPILVRSAPGNHPGGVLAYRVEHAGRALVYMTDTEHGGERDPDLVALAKGADLLICDAQYTPEEYRGGGSAPCKVGWGHSTYEGAPKLASDAGAKRLILFHHDPDQDDEAVRRKEALARERFDGAIAAFEGLVVDV